MSSHRVCVIAKCQSRIVKQFYSSIVVASMSQCNMILLGDDFYQQTSKFTEWESRNRWKKPKATPKFTHFQHWSVNKSIVSINYGLAIDFHTFCLKIHSLELQVTLFSIQTDFSLGSVLNKYLINTRAILNIVTKSWQLLLKCILIICSVNVSCARIASTKCVWTSADKHAVNSNSIDLKKRGNDITNVPNFVYYKKAHC